MIPDNIKKVSASFRAPAGNISLRHVGLLGAMAPAVKGLKEVTFAEEEDYATFEFSGSVPESNPPIQNQEPILNKILTTLNQLVKGASFTEAKEEKEPEMPETNDAENLAKEKAELEVKKQKLEKQQVEFAEAKRKTELANMQNRFDALLAKGEINKAIRDLTVNFAEEITNPDIAEFSDKSETALDAFANFSENLIKAVKEGTPETGEATPDDVAFAEDSNDADAFAVAIKEKQAANPNLTTLEAAEMVKKTKGRK